jgi:hypothetical protein
MKVFAMKWVFLFGILGFVSWRTAFAATPIYEQVTSSVGTGKTVSVSTSAWTLLPAVSSLAGRTGVMLTNDSSNTSNCAIILSTSSVIPAEATTVRPGSLNPGATSILGVGDNIFIWGLYLGTSAANVHVEELRQY